MSERFRHSGSAPELRPLINFRIVGLPEKKYLPGLVDSGSNSTYIDARYAELLGIDLAHLPKSETKIGGGKHDVFEASVELIVGQHKWESRVKFATNWNEWHHILGVHELFELFSVYIDAEAQTTDVKPRRNNPRLTRVKG